MPLFPGFVPKGGFINTVSKLPAIEWVLWGIVADQFEYDPYLPALELERLGAEPLWQANGGRVVLVCDRSVDDEEGDWDDEDEVDDDVECHTRA